MTDCQRLDFLIPTLPSSISRKKAEGLFDHKHRSAENKWAQKKAQGLQIPKIFVQYGRP
jgi:hypothetical protein